MALRLQDGSVRRIERPFALLDWSAARRAHPQPGARQQPKHTGEGGRAHSATWTPRLSPRPQRRDLGCVLDTFFCLGWFGSYTRLWPHNTRHFGEVHAVLQAPPQRCRPRLVAAATPNKAAELGHPAHGLVQRRGRLRGGWTRMDGTIPGLPCVEFQPHAAWHVRYRPGPHRGIKNPPGNDPRPCHAALHALAACPLAFFNTTPAVHKAMPPFHAPTIRVPLHPLAGLGHGVDRHGRQQPPRHGRDVRGRIDCLDLDGPPRDRGHAFTLAMSGWTPRHGAKPPRPRGGPGGLWTTPRHVQEEAVAHRLRFNRGPERALGSTAPPGPRGAKQPIDARWAGSRQHVRDRSFPLANAHQVDRGTAVPGGAHRVETEEPRLTFLLADGQLRASGALAHDVGIPGPPLLGQEAQGQSPRRLVRRPSPRSASANSLTPQLVAVAT